MSLLSQIRSDIGTTLFDTSDIGVAESVTYTPAGGGGFSVAAIFSEAEMDQMLDSNIFADQADARIQHSDLAANGVTEPTASLGGDDADTITRTDQNGNDEIWYVRGRRIDPRTEVWTLRLEKAIRILPR
jgi:hypothetical protein